MLDTSHLNRAPRDRDTLGGQLGHRMLEAFMKPGRRDFENALFLYLTETAARAFEDVEFVGLIHDDNFADVIHEHVMQPLRQGGRDGAVMPRVMGWMPKFQIERLPDWMPYCIWEEYLATQDLVGMCIVLNDPEELDLEEYGRSAGYYVEFRVCPFFMDLPA